MGRTPNALEQSPHDPTCGSARAGNHVDYREIILGNGTSACQPRDHFRQRHLPPARGRNRTQARTAGFGGIGWNPAHIRRWYRHRPLADAEE